MRQAYVAHVWAVTEYERGWGSRPDGYLVASSKEFGDKWVRELMGDRTGPAPDYFETYDYLGEFPIGSSTVDAVSNSKKPGAWVRNYKI